MHTTPGSLGPPVETADVCVLDQHNYLNHFFGGGETGNGCGFEPLLGAPVSLDCPGPDILAGWVVPDLGSASLEAVELGLSGEPTWRQSQLSWMVDPATPSHQLGVPAALHIELGSTSPPLFFPPANHTGTSQMASATDIASFAITGFDCLAPWFDLTGMGAWAPASPAGVPSTIGSWSPSSQIESFTAGNVDVSEPVLSPRAGNFIPTGSFRCLQPGCNQTRRSQADLRQHSRCHRKPQSCRANGGSCDRSFSTTPELKRHLLHEKGAVLMCPIQGCKRPRISGERKDNMRRHLRNVHKER